jgi:hypothetical protein
MKSLSAKLGARFNLWWVGLWAANVVALAALLAVGVSTVAWASAFLVLFMLPELVGLRVRGDSLPPLTYVMRRYVPRWVPDAVTWGVAGWMFVAWVLAGVAEHPVIVAAMILGTAGWLTNHWDVTYDGSGE